MRFGITGMLPLALAMMATGALAAQNNVYIDQVGSGSNIEVTQQGMSNDAGDSSAPMSFGGNTQDVTIEQIGSGNTMEADVQGASAVVNSRVDGNTNTVRIMCGNVPTTTCTDTQIRADATGSGNDVTLSSVSKSDHSIVLNGDNNTVGVSSSTTNLLGARSGTTVDGSSNSVTITQDGPAGANGFAATVDVNGSSNTIGVNQHGTADSTVVISSTGSNNSITVDSGS